eukprot:1160616-Pelagomonas_calceolata.AAC.12
MMLSIKVVLQRRVALDQPLFGYLSTPTCALVQMCSLMVFLGHGMLPDLWESSTELLSVKLEEHGAALVFRVTWSSQTMKSLLIFEKHGAERGLFS